MPGVKNAAVRKLDHELGISAENVPIDSFKFLTRVHYYAADAVTHGPNSPWGEHEMDYILFIQVSARPKADTLAPHQKTSVLFMGPCARNCNAGIPTFPPFSACSLHRLGCLTR